MSSVEDNCIRENCMRGVNGEMRQILCNFNYFEQNFDAQSEACGGIFLTFHGKKGEGIFFSNMV